MDGNSARFDGVPTGYDTYKDLNGNSLPSYYDVYREKEFSPTKTPDPSDE